MLFDSCADHFQMKSLEAIEAQLRGKLAEQKIPRGGSGSDRDVEWVQIRSAERIIKPAGFGWLVPPGAMHWGIRVGYFLHHIVIHDKALKWKSENWNKDWGEYQSNRIGTSQFSVEELMTAGIHLLNFFVYPKLKH
jgi:hypothetical protein